MNQLDKMYAAQGGNSADGVGYSVVPNVLPASQDDAPYLGRTRVAGSVVQNDVIAEMVAKDCPFGPETVMLVLNHTGLYLLDRMPKDPRTYDLVFAKVRPAIGGTFASADAVFDPERNEVYVAAEPSDAIKAALAKGTPSRTDGDGAKIEIGNVLGPADNTIRGVEPFDIIGSGLTYGGRDEHAELELPKGGGTVPVALQAQVVPDDGRQRIEGHLAEAAPACENARLKLWTHGLNPDSSLKMVRSSPLTVLAGDAPTGPELTGVHAPGIESPMIRVESGVWFDGTGLDGWTEGRDSIWCKNNRAEEAEFVRLDGDGTGAAVEFDGGMLKADEGAWSVLTDLGIVEGSEVRFKVTIDGQSAEIVATVAEA